MDPTILTFHAPVHPLEVVAQHVVREHIPEHLVRWRRVTGACELVYLSTCQRATWIFWGGQPERLGLSEDALMLTGAEAWRHLLEVATGLASANLGDKDILDQLRTALAQAVEAGTAGPEATAVFEDLLRESQRLRVRIGLEGSASVATRALRHLEEALPKGSRVALVGVGPMTRYLAERLPERGYPVTVVNRTQAKAEALGHPTLPLSRLMESPEGFEAVVTATSSPRPLFTFEAWESHRQPSLRLLDLGLPPDSEAALGRLPWVHRVDLAVLNAETEQGRARRRAAAVAADPHLVSAVLRLQAKSAHRCRKYQVRSAEERLAEAWDRMEQDAFTGDLAHLPEAERDAVSHLLKRARTLAFRALHQREQALEAS